NNYNLHLYQEYNVTFIAQLNLLLQELKGRVFIYKSIVKILVRWKQFIKIISNIKSLRNMAEICIWR
ncbi:hypothetical protein AAJ76_4860001, partial [Vairimorpha ceranae]